MLFSIVYALCFFIAAVLIIFLFAPIRLSCSGSYSEAARRVGVYLSWLHPGVLRCDINEKEHSFSIMILGQWRVFSSREGKAKDEDLSPETSAADAVPREPPIVKKPLAESDEKPSGRFSLSPRTGQEKQHEASRPDQDGIDKDKNEKAKGASGKKTKLLFGFLERPAIKRTKVFLGDSAWRNKIFRWLKVSVARFFHIVSVSCFRLHVKMGLGDPGETGRWFGYYIAAKNALARHGNSHKEILFDPVFDREIIEADGRIELSSSIARLCLPVVLAALTFPFLHTGILYWNSRKIGRK